VTAAETRGALADLFVRERARFSVPAPAADHDLVEFDIERFLLTRTAGHGDPAPRHTVWHAPG